MAKVRKARRIEMTDGKRNIIQKLLQEYVIETVEDIQDALKDLLGGTNKEMMEAEMDNHLGYSKNNRSDNLNIFINIFYKTNVLQLNNYILYNITM